MYSHRMYFIIAIITLQSLRQISAIGDEDTRFKKCCPLNEQAIVTDKGTLNCNAKKVIYNSENLSKLDANGIPNCSYTVLTNSKYLWFRQAEKLEVGLIFLTYEVWLPVTEDYCTDNMQTLNTHEVTTSNNTDISTGFNDYETLSNISNENDVRNMLIAFCNLQGMKDYEIKTALALLILISSASVNFGTLTIYIIARKIHSSREWIQFCIFLTEFLGNVCYCVMIISMSYYWRWSDSFLFTRFYGGFYFYTVKFALVFAASVDLLVCVWKPFSAVDEAARAKRSYMAIILCFLVPLIFPGLTILYQYLKSPSHEKDGIIYAHQRIVEGVPPFYDKITKLIFVVELAANLTFAILTTILLKRQQKRMEEALDKSIQKNIRTSYVLYMRLILAQDVPFSINFVLILCVGSSSPLSIWWNLLRVTYLISAVYSFIYFGCAKKHRKYLKNSFSSITSQALRAVQTKSS